MSENYESLCDHQRRICELEKELHDKEMLIDELALRLESIKQKMSAHINEHGSRGEYFYD